MVSRLLAALLVLVPAAVHAAARQLPLIDAVKSGDVAAARALLPKADVNAAQDDGTTALHWAVHLDNETVTDLLIKAGANVHAANRYQMTALGLAAVNGNTRILERLLKAGVNANGMTADGETALLTAARSDRADAVKVLLAHGASVRARDTLHGATPLMWAAWRNNVAVIKMLLEAGADINEKTPRLIRTEPTAEEFLKDADKGNTGYLWRAPDPSQFSPLMFAIRAGQAEAVRVLLDGGANIQDVLSDGTGVLVLAILNGHYELASYLLDRGANVNANGGGWTPLHHAVYLHRVNRGGQTPPPPSTGRMESIDLVKTLLARGAHVNARMWNNGLRTDYQRNTFNRMGATPFFLAAKAADLEMMKLLVAHGANHRIPNVEAQTPFMAAAGVGLHNAGEDAGTGSPAEMKERLEAVKYIFDLGGVDINAVATDGDTALHGAAYLGANDFVEFLVSKGANTFEVKNDFGWTPLAIANGSFFADIYKEMKPTADLLRRLMTERGISTEGHVTNLKMCRGCYLTRGDDAARMVARDLRFQQDTALVSSLKNAK